jgi:hypothetical protein
MARPVTSPIRGPVVAPRPAYFFGYYPNPLYYDSGYAVPPGTGYPGGAAYYGDPNAGQGMPSVIVNPNYTPDTANPVLRDYSYLPATDAGTPQNPDQNNSPAVFFLIAMKDHTIYPAIAYWVENDTLNYITQQGVRNRVSLDLVDRDFSVQLNKERSIDFALPPAKQN